VPSYYLVELRHLSPPRPAGQGLPANRLRIGFLDFLRELKQETFSLAQYEGLLVEGLEDVLLASRPKMEEMAHQIRRIMQHSAPDLEQVLVADVQVVFHSPLERGHELWVNYPGVKLPISRIFGSPPKEEEFGVPYYRVSFNLSSGP